MNVQPGAMTVPTAEGVVAVLNQEVARLALASAGGLFMTAAADEVHDVRPQVLTRYPLAPTLIFVLILYVYGLIALALFTMSAFDRSYRILVPGSLSADGYPDTKLTSELLHLRLTDPLSHVSCAFPSRDEKSADLAVALSASSRSLDMFAESPKRRREDLYVGLGRSDRMGQPAFGVWRWGEMYRHTDW
jgi:hypothetical protein